MKVHRDRGESKYGLLFLAMAVGCLVNYVGDKVLGVRIELFWGLSTFNLAWFIQIFILPVFVGLAVAWVYGMGAKWLAFFPPLFVRVLAYYETQYLIGVPEGAELMPWGWWGFFVILAMETAGIGGILGEILIKRTYGRSTEAEKQELIDNTNKAKDVKTENQN